MSVILIIEDQREIANIEALVCRELGHQAVLATSGEEGLTAIREAKPDLILLDLMLPGGISGRHLLGELRGTGDATTPVIILSALVKENDATEFAAYGNVGSMTKPFKVTELARRIEAALHPA